MVDRIQCPHCQLGLAGEGYLQRHIITVHKSELKVTVKNWFHNPIQDYRIVCGQYSQKDCWSVIQES